MPADRNDPNRELYSIAFVTVDESTFPEMRRALADNFKTTLATTEEQIKALVEDPKLEVVGESAAHFRECGFIHGDKRNGV